MSLMKINRVPFLNAYVDNVDCQQVLEVIQEHIDSGVPGYMVSLNTDICIKLEHDDDFRRAHQDASLVLMDSQPLFRLARRWGIPLKEKLSGSDLMPIVCKWAAEKGYSCFIMGGLPGVPEEAARRLKTSFTGLKIAGTMSPPYGFERSEEEISTILSVVKNANPDILFVCIGSPKSEKFIHPHLEGLGTRFCLAVGAAVDFEAGNMKRAPEWASRAGVEWLFRFFQEPRRLFKRYFIDSWSMLRIIRKYRGGMRSESGN